jgi:TRAP-type mannitol/chloroaromatic compound transport system permease large subunit
VNRAYRFSVVVFALTFVGLGIALVAVTAAQGGGAIGFVLGALFIALGAGRITLLRRKHG